MRSKEQRLFRTQLSIAAILLLLGLSNTWFGYHKSNEYLTLLSKARQDLASPEIISSVPLFNPTVHVDKQTRHIKQLQARYEFYNIVILGGKGFLAAAIIVLLIAIIKSEGSREQTD